MSRNGFYLIFVFPPFHQSCHLLMPTAKVYIVRHGETNENRAHIIQGHRDTVLNDAGKRQAEMAVDVFRKIDLDWAFTSDLKRAVETTEIILKDHPRGDQIKLVKDRNLRERGLGILEGMHLSERRKMQSGVVDETAEHPEVFLARALGWWDREIVQGAAHAPPKAKDVPYEILVVSHGGFISSLVRHLVSSGRARGEVSSWICHNVSITEIELAGGKPGGKLIRYSDTAHTEAERLVQYNADILRDAGL
ncbi:hypothetical protein D9757_005085 [Collybiopsis confluens]|uniref:Phosphoglycerate mutase-like protein n=1 Tax=Collybiopsis confluens TaxID=2823264 RepID=A0A8H5HSV9_9AGAR|nr:hypothetical protein D9757_005085 [Collybiopsis confluens]